MKMEEMLGFLRRAGFVAVKQYDPNARAYVFTITKDGVTVTDNFKYPAGKDFALKDRLQREFMSNLMVVWENRKFYNRFKDKKGESNMKDNDNLMYALAQTTAGHLHIMGEPYPVMVKDVTVNGLCAGEATTLLTVEVVGRYGDPNDKLYPKYPNNSDGTIRAVFNSLDLNQKRAVYEIIGRAINGEPSYGRDLPKIKDVIFNPPATIVFWADNTKTVVKCQEGDDFDAEKGLTMAITKKIFGNKGNYCEEIKKWVKKYKPEPVELYIDGFAFKEAVEDALKKLGIKTYIQEPTMTATTSTCGTIELTSLSDGSVEFRKVEEPEKRWKIWWKRYNEDGKVIGSGVHHTDYEDESSACRDASKFFEHNAGYEFVVSQDNPWEKD